MTLDRHGHLLNDDLAVWPMRCAKSSRTLRYAETEQSRAPGMR